ncbi:MAG: right-handed parallel beta-helix repeat-containing protein [Cytophagales bacterium]|nr:right-handed parallel beta-helix repeat-containing protein [Cytophagales bacterium]
MVRTIGNTSNTIFHLMRWVFYLFIGICVLGMDGFGQTPSGPLTYTGASNIVIQNKVFTTGAGGACITLNNCTNVTIKNCVFDSIPGFIGVQVNACTNVEVYKCTFYYFKSGVYSVNSKGINVHCNSFKNIVGPKPRGQIVQLNKNSGTGNRINYNILDHI